MRINETGRGFLTHCLSLPYRQNPSYILRFSFLRKISFLNHWQKINPNDARIAIPFILTYE